MGSARFLGSEGCSLLRTKLSNCVGHLGVGPSQLVTLLALVGQEVDKFLLVGRVLLEFIVEEHEWVL